MAAEFREVCATVAKIGSSIVAEIIRKPLKVITSLSLRSILPEKHIKPNNKLANLITDNLLNNEQVDLVVAGKNTKHEITTEIMLTYEDKNISLEGQIQFTPYDREVHDAVVTLWAAGNEIITPEMVYRAMNGMLATEKVSPHAIDTVTLSLDKSRFTMLKIDFSQEAQAYEQNCKATYEGYLLACEKVTVSAGGQTKEAYRLLRTPILYKYAQISGQIITVPITLLQTKGSVRGTEEVIVIRGHLIRQIEGMKSRTFKRSNKIAYGSLFKVLDILPEKYANYKEKTRKIRQHTEKILAEWVNQGYISSYKSYKNGNDIKGVEITLKKS